MIYKNSEKNIKKRKEGNMKKKINKKEIALFILLLLFITSQILPKEVNNLDEMWNFNFANCMANGLIPYRDFNIIQGPFLPALCSIFLRIFGKEMLVMRILAIILDTIILFMVYKIMSTLKIKEYLKYITLIILAIIMSNYFTIDYNWATLLTILIILNIELKEKNKPKANFKKDFLVGIIAGIAITLKQTTGILIALATIGYSLFAVRNKEDFKQFIKSALNRLLGVLLVVLLMVIYLAVHGAWHDFIDYAILGITTFSNQISYLERLIKNKSILIRILSLLPIINLILGYLFVKKKDSKMLTLFIFSIASLVLVYPIADESHFVLAIVPTLISFMYLIHLWAEKIQIPKKEEIITQCFLETFIVIMSIVSFIYGINSYTKQNINLELNHFKYLPMSQDSIDSVKRVGEYIQSQEKEVILLDATAAYYTIPINQYHKNYDMFLKGNLGSRGEEGQIENLKNLQNTQILIMNDAYNRNWQNPEKVREYIQANKTKIGEIGIFDIYE